MSSPCFTDQKCEEIMQHLQNYHMDGQKFWDIGASFYVGGNGKIYEGSGWLHSSSHTMGFNNISIGISFIGNYNVHIPTEAQLVAVRNLINCGVVEGHIDQAYHVVGQGQLYTTASPGKNLDEEIHKWPEWLEDVSSIKN